MPQAIVAIVPIFESIGFSTATSTVLATTLLTTGVISGAEFALGQVLKPGAPRNPGTTVNQKDPIADQRLVYGTQRLGGVITYITTSTTTAVQEGAGRGPFANGNPSSSNGNLHFVLTLAGHQVNAILGGDVTDAWGQTKTAPLVIYIDNMPIPLTVNGAALGYSGYGGGIHSAEASDGAYYVAYDYDPPKLPGGEFDHGHDFRGCLQVEIHLGDPSDTSQPFPRLKADTTADSNPGVWDDTCLQRGCAKAHVRLAYDADRFPNGVPIITFNVEGKLVYDPRLSPPGLTFSNNVALCVRDWLTDTKFGMGVDESLIDDTATIAAANICDEDMPLREGGTQKRYTCDGTILASEQRGQVAANILTAMAGTLVPPSDAWRTYAGAYRDPVLGITDSDLRGPVKIDTAVSRRDLTNAVKGTYISPINNWQPSDYPPYKNSTYVTADGGEVVWSDLTLNFVTDPIRAQRLAKIFLEKKRRKNPLVLQAKLPAFQAEAGDTIEFTHERFGFSAATYMAANTALLHEESVLGYDLVLQPIDANVYGWDPDVDEGTVVPVLAPFLPNSASVKPPTDLVLTSDDSTTVVRADGIAHSQILVQWTPPTDTHVLNGGFIEIFIKKVSDADTSYILDGTALGNDGSYFIYKNLTDGIDYDVKIRAVNNAGSHSEGLSDSIVCSGSASTISSGGTGPGPVGVANNDFEASSSLPPVSWTVVGSPTLAFETSSQQQGSRSLRVTSDTAGEGVQTSTKYAVVPGDMFTGENYKVGGYMKSDGMGHGAIVMRFYNASDVEVGTPIIADGGNPTPTSWDFYSATGAVDNAAVYARVSCENRTTGTLVLNEFDSVVLFRCPSMEDEIINGPTRGAATAANTSYRPLTNPLTAQDDGFSGSPPTDYSEIDIAAFTMRCAMGPVDISVNSGVLTGLLPNTVYHVYYDDPAYQGGAVTYFADTVQGIALNATGRFYVGSIKTPISGGLPTVGNNDGGTGAQSGKLYLLFPELRADFDVNGNQTWYPSNQPETDGDSTTAFDLTEEDTIWLGGIPNGSQFEKWTSLKLKIHSEVDSVDAGAAAFLDYSLDDGIEWHNIYNVIYGSDDIEQATAGANQGSGTSWTNPGNIADPDNYATIVGLAHASTSKNVQATGFGFAIPSGSTIDGLTITFDEIDAGSAEPLEQGQFKVQMLKAGTAVGTAKTVNGLGTGTIQLGNNTDLWGASWTQADINDANFGFEIAAVAPAALGAWAANTYYSPMAMIIDSNGDYQLVVTAGTTGGSHPTWSTTLSGTTTDNGVTWVLYQKTGLTWSAGQAWTPGDATVAPNGELADGSTNTPHFITATAGGVSCVFELTKGSMPRLGNMDVYIWRVGNQGFFDKQYPLGNPPSAPKAFSSSGPTPVKSLHWQNAIPYDVSQTFHWYAIDGDGTVGAATDMGEDSTSHLGGWEALCVGQMQFPKPGTYNFKLWHDDGMIIGFDPAKTTKLSGVYWNVNASQRTPVFGFPWMAGQNASTNYTGNGETAYNGNPSYLSLQVKTPAGYDGVSPIVVQFEIGYNNWEHSGRMNVTCQDSTGTYQEIVPVSTALKTSTGAPTWPAWSTSFAPSWPTVTDAGGNFIWVNRGPATDFAWPASTAVTEAALHVNGFNGYKETAYRAGKSGSVEPSWSTTVGALKADGTSLTWRNVGGYTASTSFDFSVRSATIDVAYLPPGAENTRAAATDEVTLSLNQKLSLVQVRYGLTNGGGEMKVYQVWVEAQSG
jgi:hypothetical protein